MLENPRIFPTSTGKGYYGKPLGNTDCDKYIYIYELMLRFVLTMMLQFKTSHECRFKESKNKVWDVKQAALKKIEFLREAVL